MSLKWLFVGCLLALTAAGCLMSEQIGEPVGHGNSRMAGDDVAIHFDTDFNRIIMVVRTMALLAIAYWLFASWGTKPIPILLSGALIGVAGWLVAKDYPALGNYRLEVAPEGLTLRVPPELDTFIEWQAIEALELEGFGYAKIGGGPRVTPFGDARQSVGVELPDWKTMKLTHSGGQSHTILLEKLSIEHRQIFANALIKRANLVEE